MVLPSAVVVIIFSAPDGRRTMMKPTAAEIDKIQKEVCGDDQKLTCQVISFYRGGQYKLYKFRKYDDVRLVFAPEFQAAFFGGDPAGVEMGAVIVVDADPELDRHRDVGALGGSDGRRDDLAEQRALVGDRRPPALAGHLGHRAAEVEVDVVGAVLVDEHPHGLPDRHRVDAVEPRCGRDDLAAHVDQRRLAGYTLAMEQAGLGAQVRHVHSEVTLPGGYAAAADLLRRNLLLYGVGGLIAPFVGIKLIDFKIEIGRIWDGDFMRLVVADEISPDSCRLWDVKTGQKLDKDVFRRDLGNLTDAYTEVARRLGVMPAAAPVKPTLIN